MGRMWCDPPRPFPRVRVGPGRAVGEQPTDDSTNEASDVRLLPPVAAGRPSWGVPLVDVRPAGGQRRGSPITRSKE